MKIVKAQSKHLAEIARLFDLYRQFYACKPDIELANEYLAERIANDESTIFVAMDDGGAKGFVQLYPSFCSIEARKIYILHDLYVDADSRKTGIGEMLMNVATDWARNNGAARLDLLTDHDNAAGQHLYEKLGYKRALESYYAYSLSIID